MKEDSSFSCFVFWGGGNRFALPAGDVLQVDLAEDGALHICSILGMRQRDSDVCVLRLNSSSGHALPLEVGGPVKIVDFAVKQVLRQSAQQGGPFIEAIIEDAGELILLLDANEIKNAVIQRSESPVSAETKANL